jgi:hypothetical protein
MADTTAAYSTEFWVHCGECGWEWIAFYLPMPVSKVKRFGQIACPKCASDKTFCGKKEGTHG